MGFNAADRRRGRRVAPRFVAALARVLAAPALCLALAGGACAQTGLEAPPLPDPPGPAQFAPRLTAAPPSQLTAIAARPALARALPALVRIASEGARPPFNELDVKGELKGFEIDLGRALCARARLTCVFVSQEWDQMIPGLKAGSYDAIISAMEPTEDRRDEVAFGDAYVRIPLTLMGERDDESPEAVTPDALHGKSIGVEADTPQALWAGDHFPKAEIKPYASLEEAILDLASDRVDFVLARKDAATEFLTRRKEGQCCRLLRDAPREPDYFGDGFAMAFRKSDDALRAAFDKALAEVVADGTFARVSAPYFSYAIR